MYFFTLRIAIHIKPDSKMIERVYSVNKQSAFPRGAWEREKPSTHTKTKPPRPTTNLQKPMRFAVVNHRRQDADVSLQGCIDSVFSRAKCTG